MRSTKRNWKPTMQGYSQNMKRFSLEAGAVIHIQGIPFYLVHDTAFEGHPANVDLIVQADPDTPDFSLVLENVMRPRWKRWLWIR